MKTTLALTAVTCLLVASSLDAPPNAGPPLLGTGPAEDTTTALTGALVSAVANISDSTPPGAGQSQIDAGSHAISLLVPDCQDAIRLLDATGAPLDPTNLPQDSFETRGLDALVAGAPQVQGIEGNDLRTLVPLTSDLHPNCLTCHTGYAGLPPGTVVGAAAFRVGF